VTERAGLPVLAFAARESWEAWLTEHHCASSGLWLKIAKKGSGIESVTYEEALDVALCFGWIDGQKAALNGEFWLQRFTPRKPGSKWSKINRDKAARLIESGRMKAAGLREVEKARADGRWDAAYNGQRSAAVPEDLQRALDADPRAAEFFLGLDSANRYAILYRIDEAKRPETRARRITRFVEMLHQGETIHPRP
jgi:uncharacterized protein YdeI (YjbR/CyaY-like superfamily)